MSRRNLDLAMCVKKAANCGAVERRGSAQENCPAAKSPLTEFPSGHGHSVCAVSIRQVGLIDESAAAFRAARPGRPIGDLCKATVREKWKMVGDAVLREPSFVSEIPVNREFTGNFFDFRRFGVIAAEYRQISRELPANSLLDRTGNYFCQFRE